MQETIIACILFLLSAGLFVMSVCPFKEKGFLFNNAYIYASKQERENMDKKPYYRQSAIVLLLMGIIFLLNGIIVLFNIKWGFYFVVAIIVVTIIYAIVSSIIIEKRVNK